MANTSTVNSGAREMSNFPQTTKGGNFRNSFFADIETKRRS
jgi:hypothetical protein